MGNVSCKCQPPHLSCSINLWESQNNNIETENNSDINNGEVKSSVVKSINKIKVIDSVFSCDEQNVNDENKNDEHQNFE